MPARLSIILLAAVAAVLLVNANSAGAKGGCCAFNAFRISGGALSHPVTVPLEEMILATSGLGSWYTDEPAPLGRDPDGVIYRVEVLGVDIDQQQVVFDERYRPGPDPLMTTDNGASWGRPSPEIRGLLDRYIAAGQAGILPETPTFAEALQAAATEFNPDVSVGGELLTGDARARALADVAGMRAMSFGVQATLVGQRDLSISPVEVKFQGGALSLSYVPPGIIAPFGLLMVPRTTQSWGLTTWMDPWGYSQDAFTVPSDFDDFMAQQGATARTTYDIKLARAIPLLEARPYVPGYERADVSRDGRKIGGIPPGDLDGLCDGCDERTPVEPFGGEPLTISVWPNGYDPFPEAVHPIGYTYYPSDASGRGVGVVVATTPGGTGNATLGGFGAPVYATPELDRDVASLVAAAKQRGNHGTAAAVAAGIAALFVGVIAMSRRITE